jgi:hypothetical protein
LLPGEGLWLVLESELEEELEDIDPDELEFTKLKGFCASDPGADIVVEVPTELELELEEEEGVLFKPKKEKPICIASIPSGIRTLELVTVDEITCSPVTNP